MAEQRLRHTPETMKNLDWVTDFLRVIAFVGTALVFAHEWNGGVFTAFLSLPARIWFPDVASLFFIVGGYKAAARGLPRAIEQRGNNDPAFTTLFYDRFVRMYPDYLLSCAVSFLLGHGPVLANLMGICFLGQFATLATGWSGYWVLDGTGPLQVAVSNAPATYVEVFLLMFLFTAPIQRHVSPFAATATTEKFWAVLAVGWCVGWVLNCIPLSPVGLQRLFLFHLVDFASGIAIAVFVHNNPDTDMPRVSGRHAGIAGSAMVGMALLWTVGKYLQCASSLHYSVLGSPDVSSCMDRWLDLQQGRLSLFFMPIVAYYGELDLQKKNDQALEKTALGSLGWRASLWHFPACQILLFVWSLLFEKGAETLALLQLLLVSAIGAAVVAEKSVPLLTEWVKRAVADAIERRKQEMLARASKDTAGQPGLDIESVDLPDPKPPVVAPVQHA